MSDLSIFESTERAGLTRAERRRQEQQHHRRRRRRRGGGGGSRTFWLIVLVIVMALGTGIFFGGRKVLSMFGGQTDWTGTGSGSVLVQVHTGDTATDIAATLVADGVVRSEKPFRDAAKNDPASAGIQPGFYRLHKQMSGAAALDLLLDPASRVQTRITVPEGYTVAQTLSLVAARTGIPLAQLQAAAAHPAALGLPGWAGGHLEGFLFPATYDLDPGTSPSDILRTMVATFGQRVDQNVVVHTSAALGITPYQGMIVASLVERESKLADEDGKVARVIYNRLQQNMFLGIDASVLYGLGRTSGKLSAPDLARMTPYNTRMVLGLPPTPIANPGLTSIEAALSPTPGPWLYYVVSDSSGHMLFTDDANVFNAAAARCVQLGLC